MTKENECTELIKIIGVKEKVLIEKKRPVSVHCCS